MDGTWRVIIGKLDQVRSQLLWTLLGASVTSLLVCLCLVWFSLKRWIAPLKDLRETMLEIASGAQNLRAKEVGAYELREVTRQFNAMLDQIDQLMVAIRSQEETTRQYQLQALSSQINPHFLYNTLDTIIWMAEFHDSQRVVQVTKSLATYFRLALNQGKDLICLSDEINHVRQYLFIQKQRYGDKLEYEINENVAFDNLVLPKLVLQPLVENALYHGIKERKVRAILNFLSRNRIRDWSSVLRMMALASKMLVIVVKVNSNVGELVFKMSINGSNFILEPITR